MIAGSSDPFTALLRMQRELEGSAASGWLGDSTAAAGAFPPINIFRQDHDLVAIVELPGLDKDSINVQAKEDTIRISGRKDVNYVRTSACIAANASPARSIERSRYLSGLMRIASRPNTAMES